MKHTTESILQGLQTFIDNLGERHKVNIMTFLNPASSLLRSHSNSSRNEIVIGTKEIQKMRYYKMIHVLLYFVVTHEVGHLVYNNKSKAVFWMKVLTLIPTVIFWKIALFILIAHSLNFESVEQTYFFSSFIEIARAHGVWLFIVLAMPTIYDEGRVNWFAVRETFVVYRGIKDRVTIVTGACIAWSSYFLHPAMLVLFSLRF